MKTLPLSTIVILVISTMATANVFAQTNDSGPEPQPVKDWLATHPNFTGCVHTDLKTGESREITCIHPELLPSGLYEPKNNTDVTSPLKQFKSGISSKDISCRQDLLLIFKSSNETPICIKPDNAKKLESRGWAIPNYHDPGAKPKTKLYDYSYDGIDKDNSIVSINNQTFYQTTLDYSAYDIPKKASTTFHDVTFSFPQGSLNTPGGSFVMLDMKFRDGFEEIYGGQALIQNGTVTKIGGIPIPNQYGPRVAVNSITILGNHTMPQAGITIYHDKIKLLVTMQTQSSFEKKTQTKEMSLLDNDTGLVTLEDQTYYFDTPNYTETAYIHPVQITFHDVNFTLFPPGFRGGLPLGGCPGQYYWADAKFADGTAELLHIYAGSQSCGDSVPIMLSNHILPQAGLTFSDGKMRLLVRDENQAGKDIVLQKPSSMVKPFPMCNPNPAKEKLVREKQQILTDALMAEEEKYGGFENRTQNLPWSFIGYDCVDNALEIGILPQYFNSDFLPKYFEKIRSIVGNTIDVVLSPEEYATPV